MTRFALTRRRLLSHGGCAAALAGLGAFTSRTAQAQATGYPSQPVKFIVPTAPGAGMDATTRLLGDQLSKAWKQPVVVENKPGGSGIVGYNSFRSANGEAHTIFVADIGFISIQPNVPAPQPVEPRTAFKPITDVFYTSFVLLVQPNRFASLADLLAYAEKNPGKLNYGASGVSSGQRLSVELLKAQTGRDLTFVPYPGNGPALTALMAGQVDLVSIGLPPAKSFIDAGKLRALAVTSAERSEVLPQVPTVAEAAGLKGGFMADSWVGLFAAPGTPDAVVAKIQADVATALKTPELQQFFKTNDYAAGGRAGAAFRQRTEEDRAKYQKLIHDLKLSFNS